MNSAAIQLGLKGQAELTVAEEHTAQHVGSGVVKVLATPQMVLLMEKASVAAVDHLLPADMCTVGAHLDVRHLEPTPLGAAVRAVAELIESDGPRLTFRLQVLEGAFGEGQLVGDGTHQRVIVNVQRFIDRAVRKVTETP